MLSLGCWIQKGFLTTPALQTLLNSIYSYIQSMVITFSESLMSFLWELFQNTLLQAWINCAKHLLCSFWPSIFYMLFGMQWQLNRYLPHQKVTGISCETDLNPPPMTPGHPTLLWWIEIILFKNKIESPSPSSRISGSITEGVLAFYPCGSISSEPHSVEPPTDHLN